MCGSYRTDQEVCERRPDAAHVDAIPFTNHEPDAMPPQTPIGNDELGPQGCEHVSQPM